MHHAFDGVGPGSLPRLYAVSSTGRQTAPAYFRHISVIMDLCYLMARHSGGRNGLEIAVREVHTCSLVHSLLMAPTSGKIMA